MNTDQTQPNGIMQRILLLACLAAIAMAVAQPAHADAKPSPPPVPANLEVPAGNKLFLVGHAAGTQQYLCLFNGSTYA